MNKIAIIPAKGHSNRLPGKNMKILCGKPMLLYTIEEAKKSKYIDEIYVTSEDNKILELSKNNGVKVINRPIELSSDKATSMDVIEHAKSEIVSDIDIVLLQPTSPLRTVSDIDRCIEIYDTGFFKSVVTVKEVSPLSYYPNGAVYVFRDEIWNDSMGFVYMDKKSSIDIDNMFDFEIAEKILNDRNRRKKC